MYYVATSLAITLSFGNLYYQTTTQKDNEDSDLKWQDSSFGLDLTLTTLQIGIYYYLLTKNKR